MTQFDPATGLATGSFGVGTFGHHGRAFPGLVQPDGTIIDLGDCFVDTHAIFADWDRSLDFLAGLAAKGGDTGIVLADVTPLPPLAHPNMLCAGANYRQHVAEMMTHNKFNEDQRRPGESDESFFARNLAEVDRRARDGMPFFWTGLHSSLAGANDAIVLPLIGEHPTGNWSSASCWVAPAAIGSPTRPRRWSPAMSW